jgi:hypothetical protein
LCNRGPKRPRISRGGHCPSGLVSVFDLRDDDASRAEVERLFDQRRFLRCYAHDPVRICPRSVSGWWSPLRPMRTVVMWPGVSFTCQATQRPGEKPPAPLVKVRMRWKSQRPIPRPRLASCNALTSANSGLAFPLRHTLPRRGDTPQPNRDNALLDTTHSK